MAPRVARLSRIGAGLMFGPPGTPRRLHGPSAGPRRAPTAGRRPAGGTVRLIFIGGPRFGRPAAPIGAGWGDCIGSNTLAMSHGLAIAIKLVCNISWG